MGAANVNVFPKKVRKPNVNNMIYKIRLFLSGVIVGFMFGWWRKPQIRLFIKTEHDRTLYPFKIIDEKAALQEYADRKE